MIVILTTISIIALLEILALFGFRVFQIERGYVEAVDRSMVARIRPELYLHYIKHTMVGDWWRHLRINIGIRWSRFVHMTREFIKRDFGFIIRIRNLIRGRGVMRDTKRGAASLFLKDITDHKEQISMKDMPAVHRSRRKQK